jgi:hypothetical protein
VRVISTDERREVLVPQHIAKSIQLFYWESRESSMTILWCIPGIRKGGDIYRVDEKIPFSRKYVTTHGFVNIIRRICKRSFQVALQQERCQVYRGKTSPLQYAKMLCKQGMHSRSQSLLYSEKVRLVL